MLAGFVVDLIEGVRLSSKLIFQGLEQEFALVIVVHVLRPLPLLDEPTF